MKPFQLLVWQTRLFAILCLACGLIINEVETFFVTLGIHIYSTNSRAGKSIYQTSPDDINNYQIVTLIVELKSMEILQVDV